jgi:hypothetical protein
MPVYNLLTGGPLGRVHVVGEDGNIAICGASSFGGWRRAAGTTIPTCPGCLAAYSNLAAGAPAVNVSIVTNLSAAPPPPPAMEGNLVPPEGVPPLIPPTGPPA